MVPMPQSRETPHPPNASWTAINQHPRPEGPVSPRTTQANPQLNTQSSPPSQHQDRSENPFLPRHQTTPTFPSAESTYRGPSFDGHPVRFSPREQTAGKPINARQDSAVFPSATSQAPTTMLPGNTSPLEPKPESHHRPARHTATHPLTPPSDSFSHQPYSLAIPTHPPMCGSNPAPSSTGPHQDAPDMISPRRRERSDSYLIRPDVPPLPHTALFNEMNTMPPPPVPSSTLPSDPLTAEATSLPASATVPQQPPRYPQGASDNDEGVVKCPHCHDTWSHPPPNTPKFDPTPPLSFEDFNQRMTILSAFSQTYQRERDASYAKWRDVHLRGHGHCNCTEHQPGSKRKLDESVEDTFPPSKSQKRDSESPPRMSHPTPPPDQANGEAASGPFHVDPKPDSRLPDATARVLGPYKAPRHDSDGMFHDVHGEGHRVKTEETEH
ncbi:hypothetical protein PMIN03_009396 [Paraphaeosphaeria minitans]|uniref:Uncharacterized protein n=1 Tax=Paraphaeosphaeria minitans TaxID=565426 RepID=A0A9P6KL85_9PLEO|nr:hypothetical protein PMIN01_11496 [Paraphaeosphaeria minitans]